MCTHKPSPPDITALGEGGGLDDLGGHPGVGASGAHLGCLVPLPCQAKVGDLQCQTLHTFILNGLSQKDWEEGWQGGWERKRKETQEVIRFWIINALIDYNAMKYITAKADFVPRAQLKENHARLGLVFNTLVNAFSLTSSSSLF